MNIKLITRICICALLPFFSCKKEQDTNTIEYPFTLSSATVENETEIQLYTNQRELKDSSKIRRFVNDSQIFNLHLQDDRFGTVTFISADSAYFNYPDNLYSIENKDGLIFFYSTLLYNDEDMAGTPILFKYSQSHINTPQGIMAREMRVAKGSLKSMDFYCLVYKLSRNKYSTDGRIINSSVEDGVLYNDFNQPFINSLGPNDTLAIQRFNIKLR